MPCLSAASVGALVEATHRRAKLTIAHAMTRAAVAGALELQACVIEQVAPFAVRQSGSDAPDGGDQRPA